VINMTIETLESEFAEALTTIATGQVVIGIIGMVSVLLTIFGTLLFGWYARRLCIKQWKNDDGEWDTSGHEEDGIWIPCVVVIVLTYLIGEYMLRICCPEYTAMQEIIKLVI